MFFYLYRQFPAKIYIALTYTLRYNCVMDTTITTSAKRRGQPLAPVTSKGKLRAIRIARDFSQKQLAEVCQVSQFSISVAERTGQGLQEEQWEKLADLLNSDVLTLRGWKKIFA